MIRGEVFYNLKTCTYINRGTKMFKHIKAGIRAVLERDPAARNALEVILCYPGFHAMIMHRIAHWMYNHHMKLFARMLSQCNRFLTGIEIHPAAVIGKGLFIDHGMGVVIGETTVIGDNVTIYQGATLGGTGKETGKRHPTIGNNVIISTGAKILGPFTVGDNSKIGAGSVVLREVPPNSTVVGIPGRVVKKDNKKVRVEMDQITLPDPVNDALRRLTFRLLELEQKVNELEEKINNEAL
jgi:serine O-acetyltransferase